MNGPEHRPRPPVTAAAIPNASWLATQGRLPLAYMGLGLAWLGASAIITVADPSVLAMAHVAPPVIALTHAWVLGFFVTIALGAMYQLAPVALGTTLWSERTGWWHFAAHAAGVPLMVFGFWRWQLWLVGGGGALVVAGVAVFAVNTWRTIFLSGKRDPVAVSLTLATGWLGLTVTAGLLLVANRMWGLWAMDPLPLLRAHAHLGLVGFFLTLLQGVTFRLIPMFTLGEVPDWRPVRLGLWLSQTGLLVLAPALAWHHGFVAAAAGAAVFLGVVSSGWALRQTLARRKKRLLDPGVRALMRGLVAVGLAALAGIWLVAPNTAASSAPHGFGATVYGIALLLGGLLPAIAGMMGKIVPFLTWMRAYGPRVGRGPTPPATSLSNPWLETWALRLQFAAVPLLIVGAWTLDLTVLRIGSAVLAAGAGAFISNMAMISSHLWRPRTATPPAVAPHRATP